MANRKLQPNTIVRSSLEQKIQLILSYAIEAPSGHNTQPWRFKILSSSIKVYANRSRDLDFLAEVKLSEGEAAN